MRHSLGKVVATAAVAAAVPHEVIVGLLDRHAARDWGDLDAEDRASNDSDHTHAEGRLFSSHNTPCQASAFGPLATRKLVHLMDC